MKWVSRLRNMHFAYGADRVYRITRSGTSYYLDSRPDRSDGVYGQPVAYSTLTAAKRAAEEAMK